MNLKYLLIGLAAVALFGNVAFAQTQAQDEQLALYYFNNGDLEKAVDLYEKLYDKYPTNKNYYQQF